MGINWLNLGELTVTKDEFTARKDEFTVIETNKTTSLISWIRLVIRGDIDYKLCGYASQEEMLFIGCRDWLKAKERE